MANEQPGYSVPIPGFGGLQQTGAPYQTPEEQAKQADEAARGDEARAQSALREAELAAQQRVVEARANLETQREQARSQLKEAELSAVAEDRQRELTLSQRQMEIDQETAAYSLQLEQIEREVAEQAEMGTRTRQASVYAVSPWTRPDSGQITPPPLPVRR